MSEGAKGFDLRRDGGGLVLFGAGAFLGVLSFMALVHDVPAERAQGTTALAILWTSALGAVPSLLLAGVMAVVGARGFLGGTTSAWLRILGGGAGICVGLAIGLSAVGLGLGGFVGDRIGGFAAQGAHPAAGLVLGLIVIACTLWFAWLRDAREILEKAGQGIRLSAALDKNESVTAEEAAALVPDPGHRDGDPLLAAEAVEPAEPPPFPYPEDVRLKGEIPEGARPIEPPNAGHQLESTTASASVVRWTAPRTDDTVDGTGGDLAQQDQPQPRPALAQRVDEPEAATSEEPQAASDVAARAEPSGEVVVERADPDPVRALASTPIDSGPIVVPVEAAGVELVSETTAIEPVEPPPAPSWEQPPLFEESDEPVDAYGTPLSLVETVTGSNNGTTVEAGPGEAAEAEAEQETAELEDGEEYEEEELEEEAELEEDEEPDEEAAELEDGEEYEEEEYEEEAELEGDEEPEEEAAELEDGEEYEEEEYEEEAELEEDEEPEEEAAELEDGEEYEEEEDEEAAELEEDEEPDEEAAELEDGEEYEDEEDEEAAELEEDEEPDEEAAELEDAEEEPEPEEEAAELEEAASEPEAVEIEADTEPALVEAVLEPQPTPKSDLKKRVRLEGRLQVLHDAGCLFLEHGRVAVSILQRECDMTFDDACGVLDELQEMGLIGPYLGGKHRDILLTSEEWLEKLTSP